MTKAEMPEKRTLQSITEELVYPFGNLCGPSEVTIRENAVAYVLCRIPEQDYLKLKDGIDGFDWFVPYFECGGEIQPFFVNIYPRTSKKGKLRLKPYAKILYLSPMLEKRSFDIAVGVVAHGSLEKSRRMGIYFPSTKMPSGS
jgi:hypothetical protein